MRLEDLVANLPRTKLLYWDDPYQGNSRGRILKIEFDKKKGAYLMLDKTLFHPKSGGQPSDRGAISADGLNVDVKKTMIVNGVIVHYGKLRSEDVNHGSEVASKIDWDWRYLLMRRHTAAHLLDHCVGLVTEARVETTDSWLGDECYIGYGGRAILEEVAREAFESSRKMIADGADVVSEVINYNDVVNRAPDAPNLFRLPKVEAVRLVTIRGCDPIPCGGTHLRNINEIGTLRFKDVTRVGKGYRISYDVD